MAELPARIAALQAAPRVLTDGGAWRVFAVIFDMAGTDNAAWPSLALIERRTGMARRSVTKAVARIEAAGLVVVERRRGASNRYRLTVPATAATEPAERHAELGNAQPLPGADRGDAGRGSECHPLGAERTTPPCTLSPPNHEENHEGNHDSPSSPPSPTSSAGTGATAEAPPATHERHRADRDPDRLFEAEFWPTALRKRGKGQAKRALRQALRKAAPERVLTAWERANAEWAEQVRRGKPIRYVPHPATWLNGERWSDEPEPEGAGALNDAGDVVPMAPQSSELDRLKFQNLRWMPDRELEQFMDRETIRRFRAEERAREVAA